MQAQGALLGHKRMTMGNVVLISQHDRPLPAELGMAVRCNEAAAAGQGTLVSMTYPGDIAA